MDKTLFRVVSVVVALAAACTTYARTGSGHLSTSSGHGAQGCAGHFASQQSGHSGSVAPHHCASTVQHFHGGSGTASYNNRNSAVDRELHERIVKTQQAKDVFAKSHPCPANGAATGNCPGYVIDCIAPDPAEPARCFEATNLEWRLVRR